MGNEEEKATDEACPFLLLPECVLRVLFSYLDSTTLYQLTRTCRYFQQFIMDPTFWKYIDARKLPNTNEKVQYCSERVHNRTTHAFFKAKDKTSGLVPYNFFSVINPFKNIKVLALENQRLNGSKLTLKDFPSCLEELSLKATHIKYSTYFFQHSGQNMQKLRVLILDQCLWVTCSFLMSVAKYESLEIISAVKCLRLHLNMVPYLNVARYGCKKLKVFDCRFTCIGHELLRTFYPKESLQSLYFQSVKSAEIDYKESVFNHTYMSNDTSGRLGEVDNSICDDSLFEYVNSVACEIIDKIPDNVLYKDPYPECTCSYKQRDESRPPSSVTFDEYYVCTPPRRKSIKFVCQRHLQDVEKLSDHFREFFLSNQHQFYADAKASEVESDPGSSDSESDDNSGTCCMYGMGRSMILLSPGTNPGTIQEEVLELNPTEHGQRGRVISIFISTPLRENSDDSENANPAPGPSRNVQNNNAAENRDNPRKETKRKLNGDEPEQGESKRPKKDEDLKGMSDEAKSARASELIDSAGKMKKSMNAFMEHCRELCKKTNTASRRDENEPTTSRVQDVEVENEVEETEDDDDDDDEAMERNLIEKRRKGPIVNPPSSSSQVPVSGAANNVPSTSRNSNSTGESSVTQSVARNENGSNRIEAPQVHLNRIFKGISKDITVRKSTKRPAESGEPSGTQNLIQSDPKRYRAAEAHIHLNRLLNELSNEEREANNREAEEEEAARQQAGGNAPRTAIITIRNRERNRYINPLFVQIENKHMKKKSRLRRLSLRGFRRITNVALDHIKNLKLDLIDLTYTTVTKNGIENFLAYNPNCRVIHPLYCVCKPIYPF